MLDNLKMVRAMSCHEAAKQAVDKAREGLVALAEEMMATDAAFAALEVQAPERLPSWGRSLVGLLNTDGSTTPCQWQKWITSLTEGEVASLRALCPRLAFKLGAFEDVLARAEKAQTILLAEQRRLDRANIRLNRLMAIMAKSVVAELKAEKAISPQEPGLVRVSDILEKAQQA